MKVKSIEEFVKRVKDQNRDSDGIYDLLEYQTVPQVRDAILALADKDTPEPFRNAFNKLGKQYNVSSLLNY